jgi:hypothetical protein
MISRFLSKLKVSHRVVPATEPLNHRMSYELARGSSYLVKETKADFSFDIFASLIKSRCQGCDHLEAFPCESIGCERCAMLCPCRGCKQSRAQGLCFTMHSPMEIRLKYALQTTPIFWISNHGQESISPADLEIMAEIVSKFLKQSRNAVVLLDGVEHLNLENGTAPVLRFLRDIGEWMILQSGILIVPVNPAALEAKELALMERTMKDLNM